MRNLHQLNRGHSVMAFYAIEQEYYKMPTKVDISKAITLLAKAFETELRYVHEQFMLIDEALLKSRLSKKKFDYVRHLAPSECAAVEALVRFFREVEASDDVGTFNLVYNYVNLNTGSSLSITFIVNG